MHTVNILLNKSFNHLNDLHRDSFENYVELLNNLAEYCSNKKIPIYYDIGIYDEYIFPDMYFGNWLYDIVDNSENEIEKSVLREILDQKCTNDTIPTMTEIQKFEICFYYILKERDSFVHGLVEWILHRINLLTQVSEKNDFESELDICFPKLIFSEDIHTGLNSLGTFETWVKHIVSHLSILNDKGYDLFLELGELEAIKTIDSMLPPGEQCCRQNGQARDKLFFRVETSAGEYIFVGCFPHTKLISRYSDGRIYFRFRHDQIADGKNVIIGWIGSHRDD